MNGVLHRVVGWRRVAIASDGGGGAVPTEGRQDKSRTSLLGRSVVLIGFFRLFRTSRPTCAMCALSYYSGISTKAAHRGGKPHEV